MREGAEVAAMPSVPELAQGDWELPAQEAMPGVAVRWAAAAGSRAAPVEGAATQEQQALRRNSTVCFARSTEFRPTTERPADHQDPETIQPLPSNAPALPHVVSGEGTAPP